MTVQTLEAGKRAVVRAVSGGDESRVRLLDLSIVPGVPVRVLRSDRRGSMILEVLGSQVMLGHGLAEAIEVR